MPAGWRANASALAGLLLGAAGFTLFMLDGRLLGALIGFLAAVQGAAQLLRRGRS